MYDRNITFRDVMDAYSSNHKIGERKSIQRAYRFAEEKHRGVRRGSGEPYINHPLRVARLVASWGFESDTIAAALLHDVVEDCGVDLKEIDALFGSTAARIVDAVTALSDRDFTGHTLTKVQKDILSDARLQRKMNEQALYVKIADRIDNLSTLDGVPEAKRIPKAEHTREIIIPMAVLEHAFALADTLEELCFQAEHPQMYMQIDRRAGEIRSRNQRTCAKTLEMLKALFDPDSRPAPDGMEPYRSYLKELRTDTRSCVSIFRQISREADNIRRDWQSLLVKEKVAFYDLTLILCDEISGDKNGLRPFQLFFSCFEKILSARGLYLTGYEITAYEGEICFILRDRTDNLFRLFIRTETEQNRYLHGSIVDSDGEFSIRAVNEIEPRDTYTEKIRVFDRDGCAVMIERGATVLDFAFYIHTDLGLHFEYAMIDESRTRLPAYTRLNEGDTVTVVAGEQACPSITWFNYVRTRRAVHHLVNYFQSRMPDETQS